jgi:hypothetical protein
MAERKTPTRGADFVARIVKDPKNPPATVMLTGYLGASSEEGHTRLYFDPNLSNYVEIPNDAILHTEPAEEDGLGASYVWIKRDAVLTYGPAGSQRPKGTFLEGPIMQDHLAAAAAAGRAGGGLDPLWSPMHVTGHKWCPQFTPWPMTPDRIAGPTNFPCWSMHIACVMVPTTPCPLDHAWPTAGCPSGLIPCPPTPHCPPQSIACQAGGVALGAPDAGAKVAVTNACPTWFWHCPTPITPCPTQPILCPPTPIDLCPTKWHCGTTAHWCQTPDAAAAAPAAVTLGPCVSPPVNCGIVPPAISQPPHCPSWSPPCQTPHFPCPTPHCPTHRPMCPSVMVICQHTVVCYAQP